MSKYEDDRSWVDKGNGRFSRDVIAELADGQKARPTGDDFDLIFGDEFTALTVAAGNVSPTGIIDVSSYDFSRATVQIVIGGAGTAKLNVKGSRDGVSDPHDLGDLITGMTAGSYILKLDNNALSYFPFYLFTVMETGGVNSVTLKGTLLGRSEDAV